MKYAENYPWYKKMFWTAVMLGMYHWYKVRGRIRTFVLNFFSNLHPKDPDVVRYADFMRKRS